MSQKIRMAISWERKELPETRWCINDQIFKSFSYFQKLNIEYLTFQIEYVGLKINNFYLPVCIESTPCSKDM